MRRIDRWRQLFELAYGSRGLALNLNEVPDEVVPYLRGWVEQANAALKAELDKKR